MSSPGVGLPCAINTSNLFEDYLFDYDESTSETNEGSLNEIDEKKLN